MAEQNPYHPYLPPDDPTLFYGRQDAIAFLRQRLVGAHNHDVILILGRIGMGKTSLLRHVDSIVDERYHPVYIDTAAINPNSTAAFITSLANAIVLRMEMIGASTYRVPDLPPTPDDQTLRSWFADEFLDVALTAIRRDRFLLLMLDDLQVIFNAMAAEKLPADFMDYLGSLLKKHERLDIAAALDVNYEDQAFRYPVTANVNFHFRLQHLDQEAARQLITEPSQEVFRYTEDAIERVLALCGGYPFLLHSVCRLLYRHRESNPSSLVTPETFDFVYIPALEETGEVLRDWWANATPNIRAAIWILLNFREQNPNTPISQNDLRQWIKNNGAALNETELFSTLRTLEYDTLVKVTEDSGYAFSTDLEADWLMATIREESSQRGSRRLPNRTYLIGILGTVIALIIIGAVVIWGMSGDEGETDPDTNAPATSTFAVDIDATRRSEEEQATSQAVPSSTITPSMTATQTLTATPSDTATSTRTPTPTRTPQPSDTDTPEASDTPRPASRTPRPTATETETETEAD